MHPSSNVAAGHPAFRLLADLNRDLSHHHGPSRSLAPDRLYARSLDQVAAKVLHGETDFQLIEHFCNGLGQIAQAQAYHFPENIFADLDTLAAHILRQACQATEPLVYLDETCQLIVDLHACFGCQSPINFRYSHDFIYGFDWAKWVRQDVAIRRNIGPFAMEFLHYLKVRAGELDQLISCNDKKYPALPPGQKRNPFSFVRTPQAETTLHRDLACSGHIPVQAWDINALCDWTQDFQQIRLNRAQQLTAVNAVT